MNTLLELLQKDIEYQWSATYQKTFVHVKPLFCSDTILHYSDIHLSSWLMYLNMFSVLPSEMVNP